MTTNPLLELKQLGQSIWLDNIRRGHILSGGLKKLIEDDGISGETSNPSIFEKAIAGNAADYADAMSKLIERSRTAFEIADQLSIEDVRMACDVFRPVYDSTDGADGFVSIEVSPKIAYDTEKTISEAKRLFKAVNRPNVMVKIPGTQEGLPAIEECLYAGLNINITLLFSIKAYEQVAWAYIRALERRAAEGKSVDHIASVASFFVSRIDTLADKLLQEKMQATNDPALKAKIESLGGKAAIANAKMAYRLFKNIFGDGRFAPLKAKGARVQRPLWASTSTKNPNYPDTLYVETLVAPDTINTLPLETIDAYRDHGKPHLSIEENMEEAQRYLQELEEVGVSLDQVTKQVLDEGIVKFEEPFEKLLGTIEAKLIAGMSTRHSASLGDYAQAVNENIAAAEQDGVANRIWEKDPTLWKTEPEHISEISTRLGWLNVASDLRKHVAELKAFGDGIKKEGYKSVVLCGMGGSSLGVETCRDVWGIAAGYPELYILDTTDPAAVRSLERKIDPKKTLFVISSKSGSTTETMSHYKYFADKAPAHNFIAITDPGSKLQLLAEEKGFRRVFENPSDIGGRYSALSYFGLVPAALMGVDLDKLLGHALQMTCACAKEIPAENNPGEWLGVVLATLAQRGRDKITFITSDGLGAFGAWVEQLIAESTGKEGKGLVPIDDEPLGKPESYGMDRAFVYLQLGKKRDISIEKALKALEQIGHPTIRLHLRDEYDLGAEFFRWEFAIAVAGARMGIDAFDQPNVEESKKNTRTLLEGQATNLMPLWENKKFAVYSTQSIVGKNLPDVFKSFFMLAQPNDYLALMAYVQPSVGNRVALRAMRIITRNTLRIATTSGFGPRFLHSTGQLHKGGANNVLAIQITTDHPIDVPIPGESFSFGKLIQAQADGDWQSLASRERRALRVHLKQGTKLSDVAKEMIVALRAKAKTERTVGKKLNAKLARRSK